MLGVRKRRAEPGTHRAWGSRSPGDSQEEGAILGRCPVSSGRKRTQDAGGRKPEEVRKEREPRDHGSPRARHPGR